MTDGPSVLPGWNFGGSKEVALATLPKQPAMRTRGMRESEDGKLQISEDARRWTEVDVQIRGNAGEDNARDHLASYVDL